MGMRLSDIRLRLEASGSIRLLVSQALRGTLAAAVPFLILQQTGHSAGALFTTIAALFLSIADAGGAYRQRLTVMLLVTAIVPVMLFAGMHTRGSWYAATAVMFLVAMAGGMIRLIGLAGIPIGLQSGLGFVIGLYVPGGFAESLSYMGYFVAGALWTILLALVVWRIRPYRRLRYQVGEAFHQLAATFRLLREQLESRPDTFESELWEQQRRNQLAREELQDSLGAMFTTEQNPPAFVADLIVLLHAAAGLEAAAISLAGTLGDEPLRSLPAAAQEDLSSLLEAVGNDAFSIATALLSDTRYRAGHSAAALLARLEADLETFPATGRVTESVAFFDTCIRHLQIAERATARLAAGANKRLAMLPPLHGPVFPNFSLHQLRANLTFESLIFRHGLRVGLAAAAGTALYLLFHIPHGIWLPLTTLLILQPHLGATLPRALHRVAGTLVGAVLASLLLFLFTGTPGIDAAILACIFFTILFIRKRYWVAVVFITPLIILLLDLLTHHPWIELVERIGNTLGGALIALLAGYILWPSPERRRLPEQMSDAIEANRRYLSAAFAMLGGSRHDSAEMMQARNHAELQTANADASLGRMLAEPRHMREASGALMTILTYLQRINRHITRLAVYAQQRPLNLEGAEAVRRCLDKTLSVIAQSLKRSAEPWSPPDIEPDWRKLEAECRRAGGRLSAVAFQVGEIIDDVNNLTEAHLSQHSAR